MFIWTSIFEDQEASNKVDEISLVYDSYDSEEDETLLQEEPKVEETSSVCGCILQNDSHLETIQERETTVSFSY